MKKSYKQIFVAVCSLILFVSCDANTTGQSQTKAITKGGKTNMAYNAEKTKTKGNELSGIIKAVIDMPSLQTYYHIDEVEKRKPLVILKDNKINEELKLSKFGENVKILDCDEIKKQNLPYIEFPKINIEKNKAEIVFRYRVEGVEGNVNLLKKDETWQIENQKIKEVKFAEKGCVKE